MTGPRPIDLVVLVDSTLLGAGSDGADAAVRDTIDAIGPHIPPVSTVAVAAMSGDTAPVLTRWRAPNTPLGSHVVELARELTTPAAPRYDAAIDRAHHLLVERRQERPSMLVIGTGCDGSTDARGTGEADDPASMRSLIALRWWNRESCQNPRPTMTAASMVISRPSPIQRGDRRNPYTLTDSTPRPTRPRTAPCARSAG